MWLLLPSWSCGHALVTHCHDDDDSNFVVCALAGGMFMNSLVSSVMFLLCRYSLCCG